MCVVIVKPQGRDLDLDTLRACWLANSDGAGIAWSENDHLYIEKGFMEWGTFKEFWKARSWIDVPAIVHFRIATHGAVDEDNTHPFWVFPDELAFAHNGMFSFNKESDILSDTQIFNRHVLKQLPRNFLGNAGIRLMMEDFVGLSSKLAFLSKDGELSLVNEGGGTWKDNGCWFSNSYWEFRLSAWSRDDRDYVDWDDEPTYKFEDGVKLAKFPAGALPPWIDSEVFYCYDCRQDFNWIQADQWYERNDIAIPECPICLSVDSVFEVAEEGMYVDEQFIPGEVDKDELDDYLDTVAEQEGGE